MSVEAPVVVPEAPPRRVAGWRFWLPMALQLAIVAAVPAPQIWAHTVGTTVLLRTAPVDPYDILRGRYMRLGYADADLGAIAKLPGGDAAGDTLWLELAPAGPDAAWTAVRVHAARPEALTAGHVVIRGDRQGSRLDWGMDQFYVPEDRGDDVEAAMRAAKPERILVEARVDARGTATLEALRVDGRRF